MKIENQKSFWSIRLLIIYISALLIVLGGNAQESSISAQAEQHMKVIQVRMIDGSEKTLLPDHPEYSFYNNANSSTNRSTTAETIELGGCWFYLEFGGPTTTEQINAMKAGLEHAVEDLDISNASNPVKVRIVTDYGLGSALASTTVDWILGDPGTGLIWYPAFLIETLNGQNQNGNDWDVDIRWNRLLTWDLTTTGGNAGSDYNLMYVIMHEFSHGMGFSSSARYDSSSGDYEFGWSGSPNIFDLGIRDGAGNVVWDNPNYSSSSELGALFTSDDVWFEIDTPVGEMIQLYAPSPWSGQAISHVDDEYNLSTNQLLTPFYNINTIHLDVGWFIKRVHETNGWTLLTMSPPVADFSVNNQTPNVGQTITFTDLSTENPVEWLWDFGDGNTSTDQNPSHSYSSVSSFTVTLTATNWDGESTETKVDYITVSAPFLNLNPTSETVSASAGSTTTSLTSNTSWTVSGVPDWFTVNPMSGTGDETLTITYEENSSPSPRTDNFTVSGEGESENFSLTQEGATPYLNLNPTSAIVSASAGSTTTSLTSNTSWTVSGVPDWFTVNPMSGTGDEILTITYEENTSTSSRTDDFTISGEGESETFSLTQEGATPYLNLNPTSAIVSASAGSTTTLLTSNTSWTVSGVPDWFTVNPMSGTGDETLTITYEENSSPSSRTDNFTVSGEGESEDFSLTQEGAGVPLLSVSPDYTTVLPTLGSVFTNLSSDSIWTVDPTSIPSWVTSVAPMSGNGNAQITIEYTAHTGGTANREAGIVFNRGTLTTAFTLIQEFPVIGVNTDTLEIPHSEGDTIIALTSNFDWEVGVESDDGAWLTVTPVSGSGNATLIIEFTENFQSHAREAVIAITGCGVSTEIYVTQDFYVGIEDPIFKEDIKIYPNPCSSSTAVELPLGKEFSLAVINSNGQIIRSFENIYNEFVVNTGNFPKGLYFFVLHNANERITKKVVVQ